MNIKHQDNLTKTATAYRETLRKNLQHRFEVARAKGDYNLIQLLEKEANYLNLR